MRDFDSIAISSRVPIFSFARSRTGPQSSPPRPLISAGGPPSSPLRRIWRPGSLWLHATVLRWFAPNQIRLALPAILEGARRPARAGRRELLLGPQQAGGTTAPGARSSVSVLRSRFRPNSRYSRNGCCCLLIDSRPIGYSGAVRRLLDAVQAVANGQSKCALSCRSTGRFPSSRSMLNSSASPLPGVRTCPRPTPP